MDFAAAAEWSAIPRPQLEEHRAQYTYKAKFDGGRAVAAEGR
jgi:hypothetical protein